MSRWWFSDTVTDRSVDGHLAFGPGIRQFLLSHSHAMYYSPSQWSSVGYVIHNLKLPNLKHIIVIISHIWGHGSPIYLSLTQSDRLGPSPMLKVKTVFRNHIFPNCPQMWKKMQINCCFSNTGHYYINSIDCDMFLYCWHSLTCGTKKQMCVNIDCSFNRRGIFKARVWSLILEG